MKERLSPFIKRGIAAGTLVVASSIEGYSENEQNSPYEKSSAQASNAEIDFLRSHHFFEEPDYEESNILIVPAISAMGENDENTDGQASAASLGPVNPILEHSPPPPPPTPTPHPPTPTPLPQPTQAPSQETNSGSVVFADPQNDATWDLLASCETGARKVEGGKTVIIPETARWDANTGNGFYGGLQFMQSTWVAMGGAEYAPRADLATREQQIAIAKKTLAASTWAQQWPNCSKILGYRQ